MQFELLRAGHLRAPWRPLVKLSFASQAITNSLPIGNAVSSVYGFRWFRRFGADNTLAVWALAGTLVAASVSLSLVAILGLGVAASEGASLDLVPVLIGTFVVMLGIGSLFVYERPLHAVVSWSLRAVGRRHPAAPGRHGGPDRPHHGLDDRRAAQLDPDRPHHRLGDDQLAARLRLLRHDVHGAWARRSRGRGSCSPTAPGSWRPRCPSRPEASVWSRAPSPSRWWRSAAPEASTAYAVLLYRLISFWMILVIGWLFIGQLALQVRRGRWPRQAMASEVEAGPEAYAAAWCRTWDDGGGRMRTVTGRHGRRLGAAIAGLVVAATLLAACSGARSGQRHDRRRPATSPSRPPPRRSVGTATSRACASTPWQPPGRGAPALQDGWPTTSPSSQNVCLAGYTGHFTASAVSKPLGHPVGTLAVAVVTTPGNQLLGTLILTKIPVRFQHTRSDRAGASAVRTWAHRSPG